MQKSVIFDLDGTLADTSADLIAAANACFVRRGITPPLDPVADALTAFRGGRAMLTLGFDRVSGGDAEAVEEEYPYLLEVYEQHIDRETGLYPGVEATLDALAAEGWALGVCTNKPEGLARLLLEKLGILGRFGALFGADTLPVRKPDPEHFFATMRALGSSPEVTMLIGDTITDTKTARAAGVPLVLVAFGPEGRGISRLEPDALLEHYDDLPKVAQSLIKTA
ncbi:MAG: HAD-IA family hydrolase [Pseudomonadota bacterium]